METLNIPIYFKLSSIIEEITKTADFQIFAIAALASLVFVVCSILFIRHKVLASGATNSVEHNRKNLPKNLSAKITVIFIAIVAFFAVAWLSISNYAFAEDDSPLVPSGDLVGEVSPDGSSIDFQEIQLTNVSDAPYSIKSSFVSISDEAKSFESTLLLSSLTIKSSHESDMEKTTIFQGNPNGQAFELQDLYSIESQESVSLSLYIQNCNAETAKALSGLKVFELSVTTKEEHREDPQITVPASTQNVDAKDYITLGTDEVSKVSTAEWNSPTSSNEGVATAEWVSGGLRVNGISSGTAQITVSVDVSPDKVYAAGSKTFTVEVNRIDPQIEVPADAQELTALSSLTLGSDKVSKKSSATWNTPTSSNVGVATVTWTNGAFVIKGISSGTATITVSVDESDDGVYTEGSETFFVTVNRADPQIKVPTAVQEVDALDSITLGTSLVSKLSTAEWNTPASSSEAVATVEWTSGAFVVNGVSSGTATITVSVGESDDGVFLSDSKTFAVKVNKIDPQIEVPEETQEVYAQSSISLGTDVLSKQSTARWNAASSSMTNVATAAWDDDDELIISGIGKGQAVITVSVNESSDGVYSAGFKTFNVEVKGLDPRIVVPTDKQNVDAKSSISLGQDKVSKVSPASWNTPRSSNSSVATAVWVDSTLKITGHKTGTAVITVSVNDSADGVYSAGSKTITVEVIGLDPQIVVPATTQEVDAKDYITLDSDKISKTSTAKWNTPTSSETGVATVAWTSGAFVVSGVSSGTVDITVSVNASEDGIYAAGSKTFTVTVNRIDPQIKVPTEAQAVNALNSITLGSDKISKASTEDWNSPSSDETTIATVAWTSGVFVVNGVSSGTATITVSVNESSDGVYTEGSETFSVTVNRADPQIVVPTEAQAVNALNSITLGSDKIYKASSANWNTPTSSDAGVATVAWTSGVFVVNGVSSGTAKITVSVNASEDGIYASGSKSFTVKVNRIDPQIVVPSSVQEVDALSELSLGSDQIKKVSTANWKAPVSSDTDIATVVWDDPKFKVTANRGGTVTITVSVGESSDGIYDAGSASFSVKVNKLDPQITVPVSTQEFEAQSVKTIDTSQISKQSTAEWNAPISDDENIVKAEWGSQQTEIKLTSGRSGLAEVIVSVDASDDGVWKAGQGSFYVMINRKDPEIILYYDSVDLSVLESTNLGNYFLQKSSPVEWNTIESSNESIASAKFTENGITIETLRTGYTELTFSVDASEDGIWSASFVLFSVYVNPKHSMPRAPYEVQNVKIGTSVILGTDKISKQSPAEWDIPEVEDEDIVEAEWVEEGLKITGKDYGETKIYLNVGYSEDGLYGSDYCSFYVNVGDYNDPYIIVPSDSQSVTERSSLILNDTYISKRSTALWNEPSSSNEEVATAKWTSDGLKINGLSVGTSTITVSVEEKEPYYSGWKSFVVNVFPQNPKFTYTVVSQTDEADFGFETNNIPYTPFPSWGLGYMSSDILEDYGYCEALVKVHANEDCSFTLNGYLDCEGGYAEFSELNSRDTALSFHNKEGLLLSHIYNLKADEDYEIYVYYESPDYMNEYDGKFYFGAPTTKDPGIVVPKNTVEVPLENTMTLGIEDVSKQSPAEWNEEAYSSDDDVATAEWIDNELVIYGVGEGTAEIFVSVKGTEDGNWSWGYKNFHIEVKDHPDPNIIAPTGSQSVTLGSDLILDASSIRKSSDAEWNEPYSSNEDVAIAQWTPDGLKITGLNVGKSIITVSVGWSWEYAEGSKTFMVIVFPNNTNYTYRVIGCPEDSEYGFEANTDPDSPCQDLDYMSSNKGKHSTTAEAKIKVHAYKDCNFTLYGLSDGEEGYDYGSFSMLNSKEVAYSFYEKQGERHSFTYELKASEEDYIIYVTYEKDRSSNYYSDRFYFGVLAPMDPGVEVPKNVKEVLNGGSLTIDSCEFRKQSPVDWNEPVSDNPDVATAMWTDEGMIITGINEGEANITLSVNGTEDVEWAGGSETFSVVVKNSDTDPRIMVPADSQSLTVGEDLLLDASHIYKESTAEWNEPSSSNDDVATVEWDSGSLKITGKKIGTSKITVSVNASDVYAGGYNAFIVTVFANEPKFTYSVLGKSDGSKYAFEGNTDLESPCPYLDFMSSNKDEYGSTAEAQIKVHAYKDCMFTLCGLSDSNMYCAYGAFSKPNSREEAFSFKNKEGIVYSYTYELKASSDDYIIYVTFENNDEMALFSNRFYFSASPAMDPGINAPNSVKDVPVEESITVDAAELSKQSPVDWNNPTSSNPDVATVMWENEELKIAGKSVGQADITISVDASDDGVWAAGSKTFSVEIKNQLDPNIVVPTDSQSVTVGSDLFLDSTFINKRSKAEWNDPESSDESIASVEWSEGRLKIHGNKPGTSKIKISVNESAAYEGGSKTFIVIVFASDSKYTCTVIGSPEGSEYGFEANTDQDSPCPDLDFMSTNQEIDDSTAKAQIIVHANVDCEFTLYGLSDSESDNDWGVFSKPNSTEEAFSFQGKQGLKLSYTYELNASEDDYIIYVSYKKNSSYSNSTDRFYFGTSQVHDPEIIVPRTVKEVLLGSSLTLGPDEISKQSSADWEEPTSGNPAIANAAWNDGALVITGVSLGQTDITVSVKASEAGAWSAGSKTFNVEVKDANIDPNIVIPTDSQSVTLGSDLLLDSTLIHKNSPAEWRDPVSSNADIATATWTDDGLKIEGVNVGTSKITLSVDASGNFAGGSKTFIITVFPENSQATYTVVGAPAGASYDFEANVDPDTPAPDLDFMSTNKGKGDTTAEAQIKVHAYEDCSFTLHGLSDGEPSFDYGAFSKLNSKSEAFSFYQKQGERHSFTYNLKASEEDYTIYVSYKKDGGVNRYTDRFYFSVVLGQDPGIVVPQSTKEVALGGSLTLGADEVLKLSSAEWNEPISSNPEVATVTWTDKGLLKITGVSVGQVDIVLSVYASGDGVWAAGSKTFGVTVKDTDADPYIVVPTESQNLTVGSDLVLDSTLVYKTSSADWNIPVSSNNDVATAEWTFDGLKITGRNVGTAKITVSVSESDVYAEGSKTFIVSVLANDSKFSYTVISNPEDSEYGFVANTDSDSPCPDLDFMSTNKEKGNTTAEAQVKVHAYKDCSFTLHGLSDGEPSFDYGAFSKLNSREEAFTFKNKQGKQHSYTYELKASEEDYTIYVFYKKDGGGNEYTDRFYFSAIPATDPQIMVPQKVKEVANEGSLTLGADEISKQSPVDWEEPISSNPAVAHAWWNDDVLTIEGENLGKAEITISVEASEDGAWAAGKQTFSVEVKTLVDPNIIVPINSQSLTVDTDLVLDETLIRKSSSREWNEPESSNESVASATWDDNKLVIRGNNVGTSKITVSVDEQEPFLSGQKSFIVTVFANDPKYTYTVVGNPTGAEYGFEANVNQYSPCPDLDFVSTNRRKEYTTAEAQINVHVNVDCSFTLYGYSDGEDDDSYGMFSKPNSKEVAFSFADKQYQKLSYTYDLKASEEDYIIYISYIEYYCYVGTDRFYFSASPSLDPGIAVPNETKEILNNGSITLGPDEVSKQSLEEWNTPISSDENIATAQWTEEGLQITAVSSGQADITVTVDASNDGEWLAGNKTFKVKVKNVVDPQIEVPVESQSITAGTSIVLGDNDVRKLSPAEWNYPLSSNADVATAEWTKEGLKITGKKAGIAKITISVNAIDKYSEGSKSFIIIVFSKDSVYTYSVISKTADAKYGFEPNTEPDSPCPDLDFMSANKGKYNTIAEALIKVHAKADCNFTLYGYSDCDWYEHSSFSKLNSKEVALSFYNQRGLLLSYTYQLNANEDYVIYVTHENDGSDFDYYSDRFYFGVGNVPENTASISNVGEQGLLHEIYARPELHAFAFNEVKTIIDKKKKELWR